MTRRKKITGTKKMTFLVNVIHLLIDSHPARLPIINVLSLTHLLNQLKKKKKKSLNALNSFFFFFQIILAVHQICAHPLPQEEKN